MPYGMTTEEVIRRLSNPVPVTDDLRELAKLYRAEPKDLAAELTVPHYFRVGYEFGQGIKSWSWNSPSCWRRTYGSANVSGAASISF